MSTDSARARGNGDYPDLARIAALAGRWWFVLVAAAAAAGLLAASAGSGTPATYTAKTRLLVGPLDGEANVLRAAGQQSQTLSQLATSKPVLDGARRRLGARAPADLADAVRADATGATRVIDITARTDDARAAAPTANAVAAQLLEAVHAPAALPASTRGALAGGGLHVIDPAEPPAGADGSGRSAIVASAALTGLLAALGLLLVIDYFRGRIADAHELREVSGMAHLGAVGGEPGDGRLAAGEPDSAEARAYQLLAGRVALTAPGRQRRAFLVSDAQEGDGGGRVAAGLAGALAATGVRVVLVDADPDAGEVSRLFGLDDCDGLAELLEQPAYSRSWRSLGDMVIECAPGLRVLPRGARSPRDALPSGRAHGVMTRLARLGDVIVLSGGTAASSAAALGWARLVESTIIVARPGHTQRAAVTSAVDALDQVGGTILGTVLTSRPHRAAALGRRIRRTPSLVRARLQDLHIDLRRPRRGPRRDGSRAKPAVDPESAGGLTR